MSQSCRAMLVAHSILSTRKLTSSITGLIHCWRVPQDAPAQLPAGLTVKQMLTYFAGWNLYILQPYSAFFFLFIISILCLLCTRDNRPKLLSFSDPYSAPWTSGCGVSRCTQSCPGFCVTCDWGSGGWTP